MRLGLLLVGAAAIASCAPAPPPMARAPEAQGRLDQLLAGRAVGPAQNCISQFRSQDMVTIDGGPVLFKVGSTYYRNDFRGGCSNLGRAGSTMVTRSPTGSRLCSGDIVTVNDSVSGMLLGACSFGEFVPYRRL